ncbi:LCP family protein [Actinokineospora sp. G85]|uniref:LCP family protein n=1 Tax=Actinokineospora sp. G85 TaxID=3406626 RepID=UPI003C75DF54
MERHNGSRTNLKPATPPPAPEPAAEPPRRAEGQRRNRTTTTIPANILAQAQGQPPAERPVAVAADEVPTSVADLIGPVRAVPDSPRRVRETDGATFPADREPHPHPAAVYPPPAPGRRRAPEEPAPTGRRALPDDVRQRLMSEPAPTGRRARADEFADTPAGRRAARFPAEGGRRRAPEPDEPTGRRHAEQAPTGRRALPDTDPPPPNGHGHALPEAAHAAPEVEDQGRRRALPEEPSGDPRRAGRAIGDAMAGGRRARQEITGSFPISHGEQSGNFPTDPGAQAAPDPDAFPTDPGLVETTLTGRAAKPFPIDRPAKRAQDPAQPARRPLAPRRQPPGGDPGMRTGSHQRPAPPRQGEPGFDQVPPGPGAHTRPPIPRPNGAPADSYPRQGQPGLPTGNHPRPNPDPHPRTGNPGMPTGDLPPNATGAHPRPAPRQGDPSEPPNATGAHPRPNPDSYPRQGAPAMPTGDLPPNGAHSRNPESYPRPGNPGMPTRPRTNGAHPGQPGMPTGNHPRPGEPGMRTPPPRPDSYPRPGEPGMPTGSHPRPNPDSHPRPGEPGMPTGNHPRPNPDSYPRPGEPGMPTGNHPRPNPDSHPRPGEPGMPTGSHPRPNPDSYPRPNEPGMPTGNHPRPNPDSHPRPGEPGMPTGNYPRPNRGPHGEQQPRIPRQQPPAESSMPPEGPLALTPPPGVPDDEVMGLTTEMEPIGEAVQKRRRVDQTLARFSAVHDAMAAEERARKAKKLKLNPFATEDEMDDHLSGLGQTPGAEPTEVVDFEVDSKSDQEAQAPVVEEAEPVRAQAHRVDEPGPRDRRRLIGKVAAVSMAGLVFLTTAFAWGFKEQLENQIGDVRALDPNSKSITNAEGQRGDENFLLVGSDSREGAGAEDGVGDSSEVPGARSDTLMIAHVPADRSRVVIVSFPRDLEINRPQCERFDPVGNSYTGEQVPAERTVKINTAYQVGGPLCMTKVVQELSGLNITRFIGINFDGFKEMVDAVDGVNVCVEEPMFDTTLNTWIVREAGTEVLLRGDQALNFVRARHVKGDPTSDYGRIKRQQRFLSSLLRKAMSSQVLLDAGKLTNFTSAFAGATFGDNISLESLLSLGQSMQGIDAGRVTFITVPTVGEPNDRNNEELRRDDNRALFRAIIDDAPLPGERAATETNPQQAPVRAHQLQPVDPGSLKIQVLNGGNTTDRIARKTADKLSGLGFSVVQVNSGPPVDKTTIRYGKGYEAQAQALASSVPSASLELDPGAGSALVLVLGPEFDGKVGAPGGSGGGAELPSDLSTVNAGDVTCA